MSGYGMNAAPSPQFLLASSSPRRHELLASLCIGFDVEQPDADESITPGTTPQDAVQELARRKYDAVHDAGRYEYVLTADTIVVAPDGCILGKPTDRDEAARFLHMLSGAPHSVLTGVCLARPRQNAFEIAFDTTRVHVESLTETDIEWYVSTGEWQGVAGGYRMQGAGAALLSGIEGSPSNVIGLPLRLVYSMLCACQFPFDRI